MIIYSMNPQDTIKITIKFPQERQISEFYDYLASIRDLKGSVLQEEIVERFVFKAEINVPNSNFIVYTETIYEACIKISENKTRKSNQTHKYQGEVNIDYEANTHFIVD